MLRWLYFQKSFAIFLEYMLPKNNYINSLSEYKYKLEM